ncbi:MAG: hydrogenase maturation nickel metallochaperone HypA [Candidatus Omnitrophota bacterium]
MHEYGIAENILEEVLKALEGRKFERITKIELEVGRFNLVTEKSLQEAFELAAEGTPAQGVRLDIRMSAGMEIEIKHVEAV